MFDTWFGEGQYALKMLFAFIVVFGVLALALWLVRRFSGERTANAGTRGRQPRLAVIDAATVDGRRRLVLIRRDNVEHLLMIGGPTDVVVEPNIVRAAAAPREMTAARPLPASDTLPRAVPLGEGNTWPLQPEPAPRSELTRSELSRSELTRSEPTRSEPTRSEPTRSEPPQRPEPRPQRIPPPPPVFEESAQWAAPEPELRPPSSPPPRERRPRTDSLSGLAEELGRASPSSAPAPFEPPPRQAPRREPRARPQPPAPAAPASVPAAVDAKFHSPADQNLAEMAQRLEAALRRPNRGDDVRPPPPAPKAEPSGEETGEFTPPPASSPASRAIPAESPTPARNDEKPARSEAKPAPQKSLYDSLEQEMASLLGRPNGKN
jgi:flagellar protein FliO/FliZ